MILIKIINRDWIWAIILLFFIPFEDEFANYGKEMPFFKQMIDVFNKEITIEYGKVLTILAAAIFITRAIRKDGVPLFNKKGLEQRKFLAEIRGSIKPIALNLDEDQQDRIRDLLEQFKNLRSNILGAQLYQITVTNNRHTYLFELHPLVSDARYQDINPITQTLNIDKHLFHEFVHVINSQNPEKVVEFIHTTKEDMGNEFHMDKVGHYTLIFLAYQYYYATKRTLLSRKVLVDPRTIVFDGSSGIQTEQQYATAAKTGLIRAYLYQTLIDDAPYHFSKEYGNNTKLGRWYIAKKHSTRRLIFSITLDKDMSDVQLVDLQKVAADHLAKITNAIIKVVNGS